MGGVITPPEDEVDFGHALRDKYWSFELGYVNLNGGPPVPSSSDLIAERAPQGATARAQSRSWRRSEGIRTRRNGRRTSSSAVTTSRCSTSAGPRWRRSSTATPRTSSCRSAPPLECEVCSVSGGRVPNATHGIYTAFQSIDWQKGDRMLYFPTSVYNACANILHHTISTRPHLDLSLLPVEITYPCSTTALLAATKQALEGARKDGKGKVRLALFDAISSQPGVVVPWEELCQLCRDEGTISVVDAAHALGTRRIRLRETRPDFWVACAPSRHSF